MEPAEIVRRLGGWFREHRRDLPWRRTEDPYEIWVSEIMLQQTRVSTVEGYYESFLDRFSTVDELAAADRDEVLKEWEGLGFYARARRLHEAARVIVDEFGGSLPASREELQDLPGIGEYTSAVLMALIHDEPEPVVDGNVERVICRYNGWDHPVNRSDTQARIRGTLEEWLREAPSPGEISESLMELGALVCTPTGPDCEVCPLGDDCVARERGNQELIPVRPESGERPHVDRMSGLVLRNGSVLVHRRPEDAMLGGLWELPGPQVQESNGGTGRLKQELEDRLGTAVTVGDLLHRKDHTYSHLEETLHVYEVQPSSEVTLPGETWRWVDRTDLETLAMPTVYHQFRRELVASE